MIALFSGNRTNSIFILSDFYKLYLFFIRKTLLPFIKIYDLKVRSLLQGIGMSMIIAKFNEKYCHNIEQIKFLILPLHLFLLLGLLSKTGSNELICFLSPHPIDRTENNGP